MSAIHRQHLSIAVILACVGSVCAQTIIRVDQNAPVGTSQTGSDWQNAVLDLNDVLDPNNLLPLGTQIWVAEGTYKPSWTYSVAGGGWHYRTIKTVSVPLF